MMPNENFRIIFYNSLAFIILLAAIYHFAGIFVKVNNAPVWRHILFVFIDLFCVFGLLKRPKYFVYFFFILTIQQYYTHGNKLIRTRIESHEIHWISLSILILFPVGLWFLYVDRKSIKGDKINDNEVVKDD